MIVFPTNSQQSVCRSKRFRQRRSATAGVISLVAVIILLISSQSSNAESRYDYDTHSYDSRGVTTSNNQNTPPSSVQTTKHEVHRTSRPTRTKYDDCPALCIVTVNSNQLRWQPTLRYRLQTSVLVVVPDYDEPPDSVLKTCRLSAKNEMSQYRAYFVPGAMDPWGLSTKLWTFSGINNVDPQNDKYVDYVSAAMIAAGHQPDYQSSSHAGNVDWYGEAENQENHDAREIGWLNSVAVLNRDANDRSDKLFEESGSLCNLCIPKRKILVVMAAPKTQTVPAPTNCCNVTVVSWVNSLDGVPNQTIGPGAGPWADSNGDGEFPDAGSEEHVQALQNYWGQWGTANIFNTNDPNDIWNHHIRNFQAATNHASQQLGNGTTFWYVIVKGATLRCIYCRKYVITRSENV